MSDQSEANKVLITRILSSIEAGISKALEVNPNLNHSIVGKLWELEAFIWEDV